MGLSGTWKKQEGEAEGGRGDRARILTQILVSPGPEPMLSAPWSKPVAKRRENHSSCAVWGPGLTATLQGRRDYYCPSWVWALRLRQVTWLPGDTQEEGVSRARVQTLKPVLLVTTVPFTPLLIFPLYPVPSLPPGAVQGHGAISGGSDLPGALHASAEIMHMSPWTARLSCSLCPQYSVAIVRSNLWPGAYTYASGK